MDYYRRFPGDYLRDTLNLTWLQDCAYTRLLDHQYATELPIECSEHAQRIARAITQEERDAVDFVYAKYFPGGTNPRVKKELSYAESRRNHAKTAAETRWGKMPGAMPEHSPSDAIPDNQTTRHKTPLPPANGGNSGKSFLDYYGTVIEVQMNGRKRLPRRNEGRILDVYYVEWLNSKGFPARIVSKEELSKGGDAR